MRHRDGRKNLGLTFYLYYIAIKTPGKTNNYIIYSEIKNEKMRKKWDL